jgi:hypothetical protein
MFEKINNSIFHYKNVEFSVREMIKKMSGGQGFLSCSCKAKTPCQSSRCACFKNNMLCNSLYHY